MKMIHLPLELMTLPPIFKRQRHALILVGDERGNFYLSRKKHYPAGISRLLGGGLEGEEDPHVGAARELNEETQITVDLSKLHALAEIQAELHVPHHETTYFTPYLYYYQLSDQEMIPSDDVDEIITVTLAEYEALIETYAHLSPKVENSAHQSFAWADYGKLFGPIHQVALEEAGNLGLLSVKL
jgi:8-oxo-dGTP pyrophosphatase MutT (NUDIX family)